MCVPAVRTAVSFVLSNRQYNVVTQAEPNMVVLEKLADDDRDWLHFVHFKGHGNSPLKGTLVKVARKIGSYNLLKSVLDKVSAK